MSKATALSSHEFEAGTRGKIPMRIHMELVDRAANHDKFYTVEVLPVSGVIATTYGRNGTSGTRSTVKLDRSNLSMVAKKIQEKLNKGYIAKGWPGTPVPGSKRELDNFFTDKKYDIKVHQEVDILDEHGNLVLSSPKSPETERMVSYLVDTKDTRVEYPL